MKSLFVAIVIVLFFSTFLQADTWTDPDFETMVRDSELIAVMEVTEGGTFSCKAKPIRILKGKTSAKVLTIGGFNDRYLAKENQQEGGFEKGDQVLFFVRHSFEREGQKIWQIWTPTTGDYPIVENQIHGSWYFPSNPKYKTGVELSLVEPLIKGLVLHQAGKKPKEAIDLIEKELNSEKLKLVTEVDKGDSHKTAYRMHWLLCAQAVYGTARSGHAVLEAAQRPHPYVQICAARALRSNAKNAEVLERLGKLLLSKNSFVQAEATRTLLIHDFEKTESVPLLLKSLPLSSNYSRRPSELMDPLQNTTASGRETMIRALTQLKIKEGVEPILLTFLKPEGLSTSIFLAIADYFSEHPSAEARKKILALYKEAPSHSLEAFHYYLRRDSHPLVLEAIRAKLKQKALNEYVKTELLEILKELDLGNDGS